MRTASRRRDEGGHGIGAEWQCFDRDDGDGCAAFTRFLGTAFFMNGPHASESGRMLKIVVFLFSPWAIQASLRTSIVQVRHRTTGTAHEPHQEK